MQRIVAEYQKRAADLAAVTEGMGTPAALAERDPQKACEVAAKLRAGRVSINEGGGDRNTPLGGYKMSGNGREWSEFGFVEYLETKAILGFQPKQAAE